MTAFQRSNITTRQERGIGPISFKRMLLAFGVAAILTMLLGRFVGPIGSCLTGIFAMLFLIAMTHPRYGMPTFIYLLESLRGWLVVQSSPTRLNSTSQQYPAPAGAARGQLDGMRASLASLLLVETGAGEIEGSVLFNTALPSQDEELDDPLIFLDTNPAEAGLLVLSNPSSLNSTHQSYPAIAGTTPVERN